MKISRLFGVAYPVVFCAILMSSSAFGQRPTTPPSTDTVSKREALAAIGALKNTLKAHRKAIDAKYDYFTATATLRKAFQAAGVQGKALEYASSWGPNDVYLALNGIAPFYIYHQQQLEDSERRINAAPTGVVRRADLQRLTDGMRDWEATASKAMTAMDLMVESYARRAAALERKFEADRRQNAAPAKEKPYWASRSKAFNDSANEEGRAAGDVKRTLLSPIPKIKYFEAISPVDSNAPCPAPKPLVLTPIPPFEEGRQ